MMTSHGSALFAAFVMIMPQTLSAEVFATCHFAQRCDDDRGCSLSAMIFSPKDEEIVDIVDENGRTSLIIREPTTEYSLLTIFEGGTSKFTRHQYRSDGGRHPVAITFHGVCSR